MSAEILSMLSRGEGETVEFKTSVNKDAIKTVCAFANGRGGTLLIGVRDSGEVVGAPRDSLERLTSYLGSLTPRPEVEIDWADLPEGRVLVVRVRPSRWVVALGDDVYVRVGASTRKARPEEIAELYAERSALRFDEVVREDLEIDALSRDLLRHYLSVASEAGRAPPSLLRCSSWDAAVALGAAARVNGDLRPTNAGLLMFAKNPAAHVAGAEVRVIAEARGRVVDDRTLTGPLWLLVEDVLDHLRSRVIPLGWEVAGDVRRVERPAYPIAAVREAVVNALTHRNYLAPGPVTVRVGPSGLTVQNPGGFPLGVTPSRPISKPRNPRVARLMYMVGLVEEVGQGLRRMREASAKKGLIFRVEEWTSGVTRVTFSRTGSRIESGIIRLLEEKGEASSGELAAALGVSKPTVLKALRSLIRRGAVEAAGSGLGRRYRLLY